MLKPKLFSIIKHRNTELSKRQISTDIVSGIIVAIIALPLSIALAIASGVTPEKGLITAITAGFFISFLGGSRVQIGGPTGAFVVIVYGIIAQYGIQGLTIATIMAGLFMIFFGLMKFGSVIKYIPYPTTTGFTSGIAVVLLSTQIKDLLGLNIKNVPAEFIEKWQSYFSNIMTINWVAFGLGIGSLLIIILWPKLNKTIPGSLVALLVATALVKIFNLPVDTIGSKFGHISGTINLIDLKSLAVPFETIKQLIRPAITIAFLASIESLLSAVVADGMIGKKHNSNMELVAQGVANIASALFGGIPATGAIARTAANVKNGGRTPISGIVHAIVLLLIMIVFMPFASMIPMTTLAAILIVVAYNMSEWRSFKALLKSTKSDISVLVATFVVTIVFDLVVAIEIGMVIAAFLFVHRMSNSTKISNMNCETSLITLYKAADDEADSDDTDESEQEDLHKDLDAKVMLYEINGPLFFGAANVFLDVISELKRSTKVVIFRMKHVANIDATALHTLKQLEKRCKARKILVIYSELDEQPINLLTNSGFIEASGAHHFFESTREAILYANELISQEQVKKVAQ